MELIAINGTARDLFPTGAGHKATSAARDQALKLDFSQVPSDLRLHKTGSALKQRVPQHQRFTLNFIKTHGSTTQ